MAEEEEARSHRLGEISEEHRATPAADVEGAANKADSRNDPASWAYTTLRDIIRSWRRATVWFFPREDAASPTGFYPNRKISRGLSQKHYRSAPRATSQSRLLKVCVSRTAEERALLSQT